MKPELISIKYQLVSRAPSHPVLFESADKKHVEAYLLTHQLNNNGTELRKVVTYIYK